MTKKLNVAILSTSQNAYSETFIQAHKNLLNGNVKYYYGSLTNQFLEGKGAVSEGVRHYFYKGIEKFNKKVRFTEKKALLRSWKKNKIDVILAEYGTTAALYLDIIEASGLPLVIHFHGFDASVHKTLEEFKDQYKRMFKYASYVIAVSNVMYDKLLSLGCHEEKLIKNTYGPNDMFFEVKPGFSKQQFIAIGRFTDKKAPYYTIFAFNKALEKFPEAKLIMAGNGHLLNSCINLVNYLNIKDSVEFVGVIKPEEFVRYLEESLAFVQHSITAESGDMEGTPLSILESSAASLPVISTLHAGIPDVIINGKSGILIEEHDVRGMGEAMIRILSDVKLAREMGAIGRKNILSNFPMTKHIATINELLIKSVN